jgi:hypothetical protein
LIMASPALADLTATARAAPEPTFVLAATPKLGGVDPLGLRQINFDLMDQVIPGLNNVVTTWAWRRAHQLARDLGVTEIPINDLRDFVDRIEVLYAWSQFLRDSNADLPGRQVLAPLVQSAQWTFGGSKWRNLRKSRRYSTAFTAPITYGPSLKTLGWLAPHQSEAEVLIPLPAAIPALDAFESRIRRRLSHPAFNQFGSITVTSQEIRRWSEAWALDRPTRQEKEVMKEMLLGAGAPPARRKGCALMLAAVSHAGVNDVASVRMTMAGPPSNFVSPPDLDKAFEAWRRVQVRQLFRLSLEALLYWIIYQVEKGSQSTDSLVSEFLAQARRGKDGTAEQWLRRGRARAIGPTKLMERIQQALDAHPYVKLASAVTSGLSFCIAEAPEHAEYFERADRLPLSRARREAKAWGDAPAAGFVRHVLESWVLAQHVYWSVGRGLADARARGKTILRLKVVLEEAGWTLAPGANSGSAPVPTPDRLQTALTLATECGLVALSP